MITQEQFVALVATLDGLIQAGLQAAKALDRGRSSDPRVTTAAAALTGVGSAPRSEQSLPGLVSAAQKALAQLRDVAVAVGDSQLAASLTARVQATRVGTPWLTVLGVGAGAVALYYLWRYYSKTRQVASFERPELEDPAPRIRRMGRSLGALRGQPSCRQLGRGTRGLGTPPRMKYEFEPEIRLEGYRRRFKKHDKKGSKP